LGSHSPHCVVLWFGFGFFSDFRLELKMFNFKLLTNFSISDKPVNQLSTIYLTNVLSLELCLLFHNILLIAYALTQTFTLCLIDIEKKTLCWVSTNTKHYTKIWTIDCEFSKKMTFAMFTCSLRQQNSHSPTWLIIMMDCCVHLYSITWLKSLSVIEASTTVDFEILSNVNSNKTEWK
jgi:hypothetical protein